VVNSSLERKAVEPNVDSAQHASAFEELLGEHLNDAFEDGSSSIKDEEEAKAALPEHPPNTSKGKGTTSTIPQSEDTIKAPLENEIDDEVKVKKLSLEDPQVLHSRLKKYRKKIDAMTEKPAEKSDLGLTWDPSFQAKWKNLDHEKVMRPRKLYVEVSNLFMCKLTVC
jgi:hypothetical protein